MKILKKQAKRGFTLVELLVVIAIIAILASLATPAVFSALKKGELTKTTHNMKQLHLAFLDFEQTWGAFPNSTILGANGTSFPNNSTANPELGMLISGGSISSEENFYAKGVSTLEPDDDFTSSTAALAAGECGMAYATADTTGAESFSTSNNTGIPILAAPMAASAGDFLTDPYGKKAVYLRIDGAAKQVSITPGTDASKGKMNNKGRDMVSNVATTGNAALNGVANYTLQPPG